MHNRVMQFGVKFLADGFGFANAELFENLHEGAVYDIIENNAAEEIKKEQSAQKLQNLFNKRKTEISGD